MNRSNGHPPSPRVAAHRVDELLGALSSARRVIERYRRRHELVMGALKASRDESAALQALSERLQRSAGARVERRVRDAVDHFAPPGSKARRALSAVARRMQHRREERPGAADTSGTLPVIPMALEPEVSIVVPVHDHWPLTSDCLRSIAADMSATGFEVIVVDDASSDETDARLCEVVGIRHVRLDRNVGFLGATNAGIDIARGRYVVLLNNDTRVEPGWLDALVEAVESSPEVGVVGAKLIYPDGRLQEAGGIIYSDASGHNYGRDQDPADPAYNFVREVDYCSGACLLVRRELLQAVGGLDTRFTPAYYEDTDLCFAARRLGYRVLYQPSAVVVHVEGASNGTDLTTGTKRHQIVNQATFREKWEAELRLQPEPAPDHVRAVSWRTRAGRMLVIDHQLPMPDHDSGSCRMTELVKLLCDLGFGVTFVPQNSVIIPRYRDALTAMGVEVLGGPLDMDRYLKEVGPALRFVIVSRPTVAWANLPMLRSLVPQATLIYDTVDLHFLREQRRSVVEPGSEAAKSAEYHHSMEIALAELYDATWVVSDVEAETLRAEKPDLRVWVVPNIHPDEPPGPPFGLRRGLVFVGSYPHLPNRDAAHFLVEEVLPLVHHRLPDVQLHLVGSFPTDDVLALASERVKVLGWVGDLSEVYRRARLCVAPLRYGAGMKGKLGQSLAHGLPVVTTSLGAEGMHLTDGYDVLLAEDAQGLADAVVAAYLDESLWEKLAHNGRETISQRYSPEAARRRLLETLGGIGISVPGELIDPARSSIGASVGPRDHS
jgi:GT2 family glycosyltransferase